MHILISYSKLFLIALFTMTVTMNYFASAATFTVNNLNDSGAGSLRQAISDANANAGTDTIVFQEGLTGTLTVTSGLNITGDLIMSGPSAGSLTVSGNTTNRTFTIRTNTNVTLSGLTIRNGGIDNSGVLTIDNCTLSNHSTNNGGAISNRGTVTITNSQLTNNSTPGGRGGAIYNIDGTVNLNNSLLTRNRASSGGIGGTIFSLRGTINIMNSNFAENTAGSGGVIYNEGALNISNSSLTRNSSTLDGGAISDSSNSANTEVMIINSTFSDNTASRWGGAIYHSSPAMMQITNSTLSANSAQQGGGLFTGNGTVQVIHSTVTANSASQRGGGIYVNANTAVSNTIISGNTAPSGNELFKSSGGTLSLTGINLWGENNSAGMIGAMPNSVDVILSGTTDTILLPLDDYGGATQTHLLTPMSRAIDNGDNAAVPAALTTDQRGQVRIHNGRVDIGAVERTEPNATTQLIQHYYQNILNRSADATGLAFWEAEAQRMQQLGVDIQETFRVMAGLFFTSNEYLSKRVNDSQFVTDLYRTFFDREPDRVGLTYWSGQIAAGLPRDLVMYEFLFSGEFADYMQSLFGDTATRPEINMVVDFYRGILSRLPDESGFQYWLGQFRTSQCMGAHAVTMTTNTISHNFLNSSEYLGRNRTNDQYVADLYYAFLRRAGDLGGYNSWLNQLYGGFMTREQVRVEFVNSQEFQGRVNQLISAGCVP